MPDGVGVAGPGTKGGGRPGPAGLQEGDSVSALPASMCLLRLSGELDHIAREKSHPLPLQYKPH